MSGNKLALADWLSLAAAPVFALMALLTGLAGNGHMPLCSEGGAEASPLAGMAPMYLLMALFHLAPWIRQFSPRG